MRSASQPKGVKTQVLTLVILDNLLVSCTYLAIWRGHLPSNGASLVFRISISNWVLKSKLSGEIHP